MMRSVLDSMTTDLTLAQHDKCEQEPILTESFVSYRRELRIEAAQREKTRLEQLSYEKKGVGIGFS
jgi:hypothetical protein